MADPFADAADYFGDDAAPTPPLSPRPALFPAPSAEEVAEAKARNGSVERRGTGIATPSY